jgi:hypothetical protein
MDRATYSIDLYLLQKSRKFICYPKKAKQRNVGAIHELPLHFFVLHNPQK